MSRATVTAEVPTGAVPTTILDMPIDKQTSAARWATVSIAILAIGAVALYIAPGISMGTTGDDANGNSLGVIFWLLFAEIPILLVIGFGIAIAVLLMDVRTHYKLAISAKSAVDREKAENKAVARLYGSNKTVVMLFALSCVALAVGSAISVFYRGILLWNCTGTSCYSGIYLRCMYLYWVVDVLVFILAVVGLSYGFYFWYKIDTSRGTQRATAILEVNEQRDGTQRVTAANVTRAQARYTAPSATHYAAAPLPSYSSPYQSAVPLSATKQH